MGRCNWMRLFTVNSLVLTFTQPVLMNESLALALPGSRIVVLDVGFNHGWPGNNWDRRLGEFRATTQAFIQTAGQRLSLWVDHHPQRHWSDYSSDARFVLADRQRAPACACLLKPELIVPATTLVTHGDLDGLICAAMWLLEGQEPYPGAVADAIVADTRQGELSPTATRLEQALKADLVNDYVKSAIVTELVTGTHNALVDYAWSNYQRKVALTLKYADRFEPMGTALYIDVSEVSEVIDLTLLLLLGQQKSPGEATVAVANIPTRPERKYLVVAANPERWDLAASFGVEGIAGKVKLPYDRLEEVCEFFATAERSEF